VEFPIECVQQAGHDHGVRRRSQSRRRVTHIREYGRRAPHIAPTGRSITHKQVHIFAIADNQITRHRAVRDDLGLLFQLGRNVT
jgi:hypothetical protein